LGQAMELKEFQKALVDEVCFLRGQIISGYSMVEYVLADISVRLNLKFPYPIEKRIKAVKMIVDRPAYHAYKHDFHRVCDGFTRYEELRHFMAHGIMVLETNKDQTFHKFVMHRYKGDGAGKFRRITLEFSLEDFRRVASEMVKYTNDAYAVFHKFYIEQAVETFGHPDAL
jgi:hypothetical protein